MVRALTGVLLVVMLAACTAGEVGDMVTRTIENTARGACDTAGNCRNTCADGSTARGPTGRCP